MFAVGVGDERHESTLLAIAGDPKRTFDAAEFDELVGEFSSHCHRLVMFFSIASLPVHSSFLLILRDKSSHRKTKHGWVQP